MSDYSINSISSIRPVETGTGLSPTGANPAEAAGAPRTGTPAPAAESPAARLIAQRVSAQAAAEGAPKAGAPDQPKPAKVEEKPAIPVNNGDNVSIHFRVDQKTNSITVFIVDRETKRVLRSIPPEEINKLQTGDLLEIMA
jgi:hypothetical protein